MLRNSFARLKIGEWILMSVSLVVIIASNILAGKTDFVMLLGTACGVCALIFNAKGDVLGQILIIIFAILYSISSYKFRYYSEIITYMGMSAPIAALGVVTWMKNPYNGDKHEVQISRMSRKRAGFMIVSAIVVTIIFYFVLKALDTPNLIFSTASILTSYIAAFLGMSRNSYFAFAYALNDIVLIIMWILATMVDFSYFPMIVCFVVFLVNDTYSFISWKIREKKQGLHK